MNASHFVISLCHYSAQLSTCKVRDLPQISSGDPKGGLSKIPPLYIRRFLENSGQFFEAFRLSDLFRNVYIEKLSPVYSNDATPLFGKTR